VRASDSDVSKSPASSVAAGLAACKGAFIAVGALTGVINVLMLTGSLFMLQVYDRVLPSRSVPTLLALGAMAAALFAFQGFLDMCRGRILVRIGSFLNENLNERIYDALARVPLKIQGKADGIQPVRDLDQIQGFLSGLGPTALFDMPWMPLYLGICFVFHPWIGITALAGALVLVSLTLWTEVLTRAPAKATAEANARRLGLAEVTRRNAEVLQAMGMRGHLAAAWSDANERYRGSSVRTADVAGGLGAASRVLRMMLQSTVLAVGAYLAINQEATAGIIIASSILVSRALAPVELAIANWKGFVAARQSRTRLTDLLKLMERASPGTRLPPPAKSLAVEALNIAPPGQTKIVVSDASFALQSGQGLGIIGPSASGKSSLARGLVGIWTPARGKVRLDGAALEQWSSESLGPHIGYLPQDVELFDGRSVRRGRARSHRPLAGRLRRPRRRGRPGALRGAAAAYRAGACAVRRSFPGRARRAEFKPRRRGRRGADACHPGRTGTGSDRDRHRSSPLGPAGRRSDPCHGERTRAGVRAEGRGVAEGP
jgi:PrtD family type I secretion system ABC transporter